MLDRSSVEQPVAMAQDYQLPRHVALLSYFLAILIAILRRPDFVTNPQFWAEDGRVWFQQAYNEGVLHALLQPYAGYYHLLPRVSGALAVQFGIGHAPAVLNWLSVLAYAAPVPLLLSMSRGPRNFKFLAACIAFYLLLPYSWEWPAPEMWSTGRVRIPRWMGHGLYSRSLAGG